MRTLKISQVKTIFSDKVEKPIVVFVTVQGIEIARTPKQALLDLQNSGRALNLSPNLFDRGLGGVSVQDLGLFKKALFACVGAEVSGEIKPFKKGDTFIYTEGHPALTDRNHKNFGVKLGDKGVAESDGVWVEQFLSIPETQQEALVDAIATKTAGLFANMFGMSVPSTTSAPVLDVYETETDEEEQKVSDEAVGTKK